MALSVPQIIECFHLCLLSVLSRELGTDQVVLKGGANLRYFFASQRYSEDIDLDVVRLQAWQVKEKVDRALQSQVLNTLLRAEELEIEDFSAPKQTETTQRWKVAVNAKGRPDPVRTKLELSHRELDGRFALDPVPEAVVAEYAIRPPTVQHYLTGAAIEQKVHALAGRAETQARDVFDLELLFRGNRDRELDVEVPEEVRDLAVNRTIELPFDAFRDQVLPFLEPEVAESLADHSVWEQMQTYVASRLEALDASG